MKAPWILPAAALAAGAVGGFITGKNTSSEVAAEQREADSPIVQTRPGTRAANGGAASTQRRGTRATSVDEIYRTPGNLSRLDGLMRYYGGLDADQLQAEAAKLDDLPLNERIPASFLLFARWAELDPHGAMAYSNSMGMQGALVRPTILQSWASVDPENAARYFSANPGEFAMMRMGRGLGGQDGASVIATEWARQDPQGALAWANTLTQGKSGALAAVLGEVAKSDPQEAARMLDQIPADERGEAYASIASRYGASDFAAAEAWIRTLPQDRQAEATAAAIEGLASKSPSEALAQINSMPEGDAKYDAIPALVGPLARTDPRAAGELLASHPDENTRREAIRELMPAWTAQDPAAALEYARSQEPGPMYDRAVASFVASNHSGNPQEMVRLSETIENERERTWSVGFAAQRWMQSDPDDARAYLQQTDAVSDTVRERLIEGQPVWGGGRGRGRGGR